MLPPGDLEIGQQIGIGIGYYAGRFLDEGDLHVGSFMADVDVLDDAVEAKFEGEAEGVIALLGAIEEDGLFIGVVFPGDVEMGVAGGVQPLMEEGVEVFLGDRVYDVFEVVR